MKLKCGILVVSKTIHSESMIVAYDSLIIATGVTHNYFGNNHWAKYAPGLKSVEDAIKIRQRILMAFDRAEKETDPKGNMAVIGRNWAVAQVWKSQLSGYLAWLTWVFMHIWYLVGIEANV